MSQIDLDGDSWENARGVVENILNELVAIVKGNGKAGMVKTLDAFMGECRYRWEVEDRSAAERAKAIQRSLDENNAKVARDSAKTTARIGWLALAVSFLTLILGLWVFYEGRKQAHGDFTLTSPTTALSSTQEPEHSGVDVNAGH